MAELVIDKLVQDKIDYYLEKVEQIKLLNSDVILAKQLMPEASIWLDHEVNIDWAAKSMQEVKDALARFARAGIMLDNFVDDTAKPIWYLKGIGARIRLAPIWCKQEEADGATCHLVQVGEEICTYPKYKLVCDDKEVNNATT
jgi:hypothetical protein